MQIELREFLYRFGGVVLMSLAPVVFVAFISMPISLGRHPGEAAYDPSAPIPHMT